MKKENYVYYKDGKTIYYKIIEGDIMDYIADYETIIKIKTSYDIPNNYKLMQLVLIEKDDDEQEKYSKYFAIKIK